MTAHSPSQPLASRLKLVPLNAYERIRLYRESRLIATAVMLMSFPALVMSGAQTLTVTAALLLFVALPAVIALDVRRPAHLDRAVLMGMAAMSAVLLGGVLKGLPGSAAALLFAMASIEAGICSSVRVRALLVSASIVVAFAFLMLDTRSATAASIMFMEHPSMLLALGLAVINVLMLVRGLSLGIIAERQKVKLRSIQGDEIGEIVSEAVVAADSAGNVVRVSASCERILGLPGLSLLGRGLHEMILVSDRPTWLSAVSATINEGQTSHLRVRLRHSPSSDQPSYRWTEMTILPSHVSKRTAVATIRDIEAKVAEEEHLRQSAAEAEQAKSAQAAFLSTVNHELRTPLNAIIGFSEVIANPLTTPKDAARVQEYAAIINGSGHDLLRMVTAMIDITRLDSGVYDASLEEQDLNVVVATCIEGLKRDPAFADARLEVDLRADAPTLPLDARVLRSVLQQLLSNALKFGGKESAIRITTQRVASHVELSIADSGPGIPTQKLAEIGKAFGRLDQRLSRDRGGLGLGLSLASGLAKVLGARLRVDSAPGEGTRAVLLFGETVPRSQRSKSSSATVTPLKPRRARSVQTLEPKVRRRHG